jgi:tetratricopeptide (TPR) repeat protein
MTLYLSQSSLTTKCPISPYKSWYASVYSKLSRFLLISSQTNKGSVYRSGIKSKIIENLCIMNMNCTFHNITHTLRTMEQLDDSETPRKKLRPTSVKDSVNILNEIGISSFHRRDFKISEKFFSQALSQVDMGHLSGHIELKTSKLSSQEDAAIVSCSDDSSDCDEDNTDESRAVYDEGMRIYNGPLSLNDQFHNDMAIPTLCYNIAQTYIQRGRTLAAKSWLQRSLSRCREASDHFSSVLAVKTLHCLVYCSYSARSEDKALDYCQQALSMIMELKLGDVYSAAAYNFIGVLHFNMRSCNTGTAMQMFCQSLELYRSCKSLDRVAIATVLNNIGRVYYLRSEFEEALQIYQESLQIRQQLLGDNAIDVAATTYNIGQTCHQLGRLSDSLVYYKEFLKIATSAFGNDSKDVALVLKGIAEIHHERGDLEMAIDCYNQALKAQSASCGMMSAEVATTLNKLGNLCYEMKDFVTAMKHYKDGLKIEHDALAPNHPHTIVTLTNIAHIHKQLGAHEEALDAYDKVRMMQIKASGGESIQLAETLASIGLMQYHMHDYCTSFDSYQAALRIRRQHFGNDEHQDIASTLNSIGLVLFKQDMYELAKKCFTESLRIRRKLLGPDHRDVAILWYNIATIHFETGEDEIAVQLYKEALRVERASLGSDHPDVALTLQHLGQVHQQLGLIEQALGYFSEALDVEKNRGNPKRSTLGRTLNLLGNIYLQLGRTSEMMHCYIEASRIYEDHQPTGGETLVIAGYNLYGLSKTNPPCAPVA